MQGINLFEIWLKKTRQTNNLDVIQTEDLDVHKERLRVSEKKTDVKINKIVEQKFIIFFQGFSIGSR